MSRILPAFAAVLIVSSVAACAPRDTSRTVSQETVTTDPVTGTASDSTSTTTTTTRP